MAYVAHYSKSLIYVQKFNFLQFTIFSANFARHLNVRWRFCLTLVIHAIDTFVFLLA